MDAEKVLRQVRARRFSYPPEKEAQLDRILAKLKRRLAPKWEAEYWAWHRRVADRKMRLWE